MRHVFVCERHEDHDRKGWRLKSQPGFDPLTGLAVAHDILEHFPGDDDGPAAELRAVGAMIYVRAQNGYWMRPFAQYGEILCTDFRDVFSHWKREQMTLDVPPARRRPMSDDAHDFIEAACRAGRQLLLSEFEHELREGSFTQADVDHFITCARGWMRIGYGMALRRYRRCYQHSVKELFERIEHEADQALKVAEEGYELHVGVIGAELRTCRLVEPTDYY